MPKDLVRIEEIFTVALAEHDAAARARYLDATCDGDADLRGRVEALLAAHDTPENFLKQPAAEAPADSPAYSEAPGTIIGRYQLLEQIGEGGFGVVFLAQQDAPVRRRVALKILKPGMDTREVIGRFAAERQALAMMDHPHIAKVFDAGATDAGRPYFVMELVQGVPITEYCDQCNLATRERLELFVTVCQAVQHAHQQGVIHRDIKPTNVLVAIEDGRPAPKIIDFGVAKAVNQRLTEHTLTTAFAQMVGSPLYMSPEQAELSPLGVDTRSDIYSLGVLLYELLTGATPFDKERLHAAPFDEFRRIIREEEPPRPSARISTLAADLATTIAEHRRTGVRRLRQTVRGELDWVVMKCLEKDRSRRYDSAGSLGRDVERYLHDEPVQACPPSAVYRLKKFVRRNKIAAAFVLLLVAAVAGLTVSNIQTRRSERRAAIENAKAQAVSEFLQEMLRSANPDEAKDAQYTVRQLLDETSSSFGALADQQEVEAEIRATIGRAYWRLGALDKADQHLTRALELRRSLFGPDHESVAESLVDLAWCRREQVRQSEAEAAALDALRIYRDRRTAGSPVFRTYAVLQVVLSDSRRMDEALSVTSEAMALAQASGVEYPEIAELLHNQANIYIEEGRYAEAEQAARQAVEMHRRLHEPGHPETAWGLYTLGSALQKQQKFTEAEDAFRKALTIFRDRYRGEHDSLTITLGSLRQVLQARGDQSALEALDNEVAQRSENPGDDVRMARLLLKHIPTADQKQEARRLIRRAIDGYGKMAADYPDDLDRRFDAASGFVDMFIICAATPGFEDEVDEVNRWLAAEIPKLAAAFPGSDDCQWWAARLYRVWAYELTDYAALLPMAERHCRDAIDILEKRFVSDPKRPQASYVLANSYVILGEAQWRLAKLDDAEAAFRRALEIYDEHAAVIAADPLPEVPVQLASDYLRSALFFIAVDKNEQASELVRTAALHAKYARNSIESVSLLFALAIEQLHLGDDAGYLATCRALADLPFDQLDDLAKARVILASCLAPDALEDPSLVVTRAEDFAANNSLGQPHVVPFCLGAALYRSGKYDVAEGWLEKSIAMYPSQPQPGYEVITFQQLLLAMAKWRLGKQDEAREWLEKTLPGAHEENQAKSTWPGIGAVEDLFRREAEDLIEPKESIEVPINDNSAPTTTDN